MAILAPTDPTNNVFSVVPSLPLLMLARCGFRDGLLVYGCAEEAGKSKSNKFVIQSDNSGRPFTVHLPPTHGINGINSPNIPVGTTSRSSSSSASIWIDFLLSSYERDCPKMYVVGDGGGGRRVCKYPLNTYLYSIFNTHSMVMG